MNTAEETFDDALSGLFNILPREMDTDKARVMLMAICLQESRLIHRRQLGNGPARGLAQFEMGTKVSKGGVWGVFLHPASQGWLARLCEARGVICEPDAIWRNLEFDDTLAMGVARLLLWTDPKRLPETDDAETSWALYLRTWRPGKPHPETWVRFHKQARAHVVGE